MWPRVVEIQIAIWLLLSPFIFDYSAQEGSLWAIAYGSATFVTAFALLSFHPRWSFMHRYTLAVAGALILTGYFMNGTPPDPALQNFLVTGLLLLMLSPLPSNCSEPP